MPAARHRLPAACLSLALLVATTPAAAWNAAGHRLSAAIAWQEMREETRHEIAHLLAGHPEHGRWTARAKADDRDYTAFVEASTWPDDIKRDRRFYDEGKPPTETLAGFPDMARHRRWHHADHRLDNGRRSGKGELDSRLPQLMRMLADRQASAAARSYALPWLIHLVADAHQPLHVVSRHDEAGDSDEGGNGLWVETPLHPRLREMSLHAYWDDLPGPPWLRGDRLEAAATALRAHPATKRTGEAATELADWLAESRELARTAVYNGLDGTLPVIDERYDERARRTAMARIALAGHRLAKLLDTLLAGSRVSRTGPALPILEKRGERFGAEGERNSANSR